jgi:hypothetical protein
MAEEVAIQELAGPGETPVSPTNQTAPIEPEEPVVLTTDGAPADEGITPLAGNVISNEETDNAVEATEVDTESEDVPVPALDPTPPRRIQAIRNAQLEPNMEDVDPAYQQGMEVNALTSAQIAIQKASDGFRDIDQKFMALAAKHGIDLAEEASETVGQEMFQIRSKDEQFMATIAQEYAHLSMVEGAEFLSEEQTRAVAADMYISRMISEQMADQSYLGLAKDLLGLVFIPDESASAATVLGELGLGGDTVGERFLNSGKAWQELGYQLKLLPPEDRIVAFQQINEILLNSTTANDTQRAIALMDLAEVGEHFIGARTAQNIEKAFIPLDIFGVGKFVSAPVKAVKGVGQMFKTLARTLNPMRLAARSGDTRTAARIADVAASSQEGAKATNVPREVAAASADPSTDLLEVLLEGKTTGMASVIRKEFREADLQATRHLDIAHEGLGFNDEEKVVALGNRMTKLEDILRAEETAAGRTLDMEDLVYSSDALGVTLDYKTLKAPLKMSYTLDQVTDGFASTGLDAKRISFLSYGMSPNYLIKEMFDKNALVNTVERIGFQSAKLKRALLNDVATPFRAIPHASKKRVSELLTWGDSHSEIFTYEQAVTKGVNSVYYTPEEFHAYAAARRSFDRLGDLKNTEIRNAKLAKGERSVTVGGQTKSARVFDVMPPAADIGGRGIFRAGLKAEDGAVLADKIEAIPMEELAELYEKGWMVARSDVEDAWRAGEKGSAWSLIKKTDHKDLPAQILNRKLGYVPRVYENARYFAGRKYNVVINGITKEKLRTERYFDNIADAEAYTAKQGDGYVNWYNREAFSNPDAEETVALFGSMYDSSRGQKALVFGTDGDTAILQDPIAAMGQYMEHISARLPASEYRLGIQKRYINHARKFDSSISENFTKAVSDVRNSTGIPADQKAFLNAAADQIHSMMKVPTPHERRIAESVRGMAETASKQGRPKTAKFWYSLSDKSLTNAVRGANFNLMLGTFAPAQLVVQAFGSTMAMSINPVLFTKQLRYFNKFRELDNIKDTGAFNKALKGMSAEDANVYRLWDRTGLRQSMVATAGDANAGSKMPDLTGGTKAQDAAGWAKRRHLMFFEMGELANMRNSFGTSVEWFKQQPEAAKAIKAAGGLGNYKFTDGDMASILKRTESYRLHMSSGNKAAFQKGLAGIPFQFQQVNTKYIEALVGNDFNKVEKFKLGLGQTLIMGTAGIPLLPDDVVNYMLEQVGITQENLEPGEIATLTQGMVGLFLTNFDIDAAVAGRVSFANDFIENAWGVMFNTSQETLASTVLGPSGHFADMGLGIIRTISDTAKLAYNADDVPPSAWSAVASRLADSAAQVSSTSRNLINAYDIASTGLYHKANGDRVEFDDDMKIGAALRQSMGFQTQTAEDIYELGQSEKARVAWEGAAADRAIRHWADASRALAAGDEDAYDFAVWASTNILQSVKNLEARARIEKQISAGIATPKNAAEEAVNTAIMNKGYGFQEDANAYNPTYLKIQQRHRDGGI